MPWETSRRKGSTRAGRKVRLEVLARNGGLCVLCNSEPATICDHITPVSEGAPERYEDCDPGDLRGVCESCNKSLTAEQSRRARMYGRWRPGLRPREPHPGDVWGGG